MLADEANKPFWLQRVGTGLTTALALHPDAVKKAPGPPGKKGPSTSQKSRPPGRLGRPTVVGQLLQIRAVHVDAIDISGEL